MPIQLRCPECNKPLKVREELAGKKVKCPGCGKPVPVPAAEPEEPEPVVEEVEEAPPPKPAKAAKAALTTKPKAKPEPVEEDEPDEDEGDERGKVAKVAKGGQQWVPCPNCGATGARRVKYTFWGSFYGPRLFSHVRCQQCRTTYNGKTGGSNLIPAIACVTVPAILIIIILGLIGLMLWWKLYGAGQ
jgi:hypothetical protein